MRRAPATGRDHAGMDLIEIKDKQRLRREDAATRLRELADHLERHNDVELDRDGLRIRAHVPDEVDFKLEFEVGDDGTELEIELTW
jgi:amphi-Trp domain-containing protein